MVKSVVLKSGPRFFTKLLFVAVAPESITAAPNLRASICGMRFRMFVCFFLTLAFSSACLAQSASSNLYPMEEGFVDSHGALIYYKVIGRGAPLVIVHGGPG